MELALQFAGALGILLPFVLLQFRLTSTHSWLYLSGNLAGAAILAWTALIESQWGFVILEGVWALAALVGISRRISRACHRHRHNFGPFYLRLCGLTGLIGCISALATDVAGILLHESYDWIAQSISALAAGRYGWIQDIGLYHLSIGLIAGAAGLFPRRRGGMSWRIGCLLLALLGVDVFALMRVNEYAGSRSAGSPIHPYCIYALDLLTIPALFCLAPGLWRRKPLWGKFSVAVGVSWTISIPIYLLVPISWEGAYERALALPAILWFAGVSELLRRFGYYSARQRRRRPNPLRENRIGHESTPVPPAR